MTITESGRFVQLQLGAFACGRGVSLQEAADDLTQAVLRLAMATRSGGFAVSREIRPDLETMQFLAEVGELAAAGEDIRPRLFD